MLRCSGGEENKIVVEFPRGCDKVLLRDYTMQECSSIWLLWCSSSSTNKKWVNQ